MERFKGITIILLLAFAVPASAVQTKPASVLLQEGLYAEEIEGNLEAAIKVYERILKDFPKDRPVAAKALLHIGLSYEKLGKQEAQKAYRRVIQEFADQREVVAQARTRLSSLEQPIAQTEPKGMTVRKVWEGLGVDDCGAISPDGKYLSHVDWGTGDLAVYEIATGKKRHITNKGSWDDSNEFAVFSRWSPDSKQIVYSWYNKQEHYDLRVIGIDDAEPRVLFSDPNCDSVHPCDWSNDGERILACLWRKDGAELVSMSVRDGAVQVAKKLKFTKGRVNVVFSPEGDDIIYDAPPDRESGNHDIFLFSIESGTERALVKHPSHDYVLDWGPDGKHLLFASDRTGTSDIWTIKIVDGKALGAPQLIKSEKGPIPLTGLGSTTEGLFYYCNFPGRTDVYVTEIDPKTGEIVAPPHEAINRFVGSNATPDYSPDGKYMAYVSRRGPFNATINRPIGNVLCIRSLETGEDREFRPPRLNKFGYPRWSPDSRSVMVVNWEDDGQRTGHYEVDAQTGKVKLVLLTQKPQEIHHHEWSTNGKSVFLVRSDRVGDRVRMQIVAREIESGAETELLSGTWRDVYSISRSPDGRWLAVLGKGKKRNLRVIPTTGGEPRIVHTFEQGDNRTSFHVWSADSKYIFLTKLRPPKSDLKWDLWRIPVEGGQAQSLGLEMNTFWWLSAHPNGRHIAFSSRASDYDLPEVWVMENFLPEEKVAHQPNFRKIRIPTRPGNGMLSPDGKKLAFVSEGSIWVVPVHGKVSPDIAGEPVRLPGTEKAWHWCMSWSADGAWIAYGNPGEICIVPSSGGKVKRISVEVRGGNNVFDCRLSMSRDGRTVAYSSEVKDKMQIFTADVESGDFKQLTPDGGKQPCFSPDGKKIAFVKPKPQKTENPKRDVWVIPATGGTPVQVSDLPGRATGPIWSPDGKMIAFTRRGGDGESKEICIVPVSETGNPEASPTQIELPLETWRHLAGWTPDNAIGVLLSNPEHQAIYTVPASGGNATQVTPQGYTFHPRWSPDAERIYFRWNGGDIASVPSGGGDISTVPLDADSKIFVALPGAGNAVSPDGKKIVFSGAKMVFTNNKKAYEVNIYTIPIEGGEPKKLTISPGQDRFPCWSPDGKSIAFIRYPEPTKEMSICIVPAEGGEVSQLASKSGKVAWSTIAWSPDGKSIAYFSKDTIRVIPVQGGESSQVVKVEDVSSHSELAWSPDGTKLLYSSKGSIWVISSDGGQPEEIETGLDAKACHVSWSPDGKKIAFAATRGGDAELWLMENFLPEPNDRQ